MSDPFADLIPQARAFLAELAVNNRRDWFNEHKPRYDAQLRTPARMLLDHVAADLTRGGELTVSTKLFRPHRDVRFSKDKTPYSTHLHMGWTLQLPGRAQTGFFFGIAPDYVRIGGGIMGFDKDQLTRWRAAVAADDGTGIEAALADLKRHGYRADAPELKRVPAPYDKDHLRAELLRRKSLTVWRDLDQGDWSAPHAALLNSHADLSPALALLAEMV